MRGSGQCVCRAHNRTRRCETSSGRMHRPIGPLKKRPIGPLKKELVRVCCYMDPGRSGADGPGRPNELTLQKRGRRQT
jgi:hypothetical protein